MKLLSQAADVISISLALGLFQITGVVGSKCIVTDSSRASRLNDLSPLEGRTFTVNDAKYKYTVGICTDVSTPPFKATNASVIRSSIADAKLPPLILGRFNDTDIVSGGNWILLTYAGGDLNSASALCNGTLWKTLIVIYCNSENRDIKFELADPLNAVCATVFHVETSLVCPAPGQSAWTVFFMLLLTAVLCYLIIGMAYRRFVTGAKGLEQIPNYNFWRNPCAYIQESLESRDPSRGRNQPWNQNVGGGSGGGSGDPSDEPLLHP